MGRTTNTSHREGLWIAFVGGKAISELVSKIRVAFPFCRPQGFADRKGVHGIPSNSSSQPSKVAAMLVAAMCFVTGLACAPVAAAQANETSEPSDSAPQTVDAGSLPSISAIGLNDAGCIEPTKAGSTNGTRLVVTHDGSTLYSISSSLGSICKIDTSTMEVEARASLNLGDTSSYDIIESVRLSPDESMLMLPGGRQHRPNCRHECRVGPDERKL